MLGCWEEESEKLGIYHLQSCAIHSDAMWLLLYTAGGVGLGLGPGVSSLQPRPILTEWCLQAAMLHCLLGEGRAMPCPVIRRVPQDLPVTPRDYSHNRLSWLAGGIPGGCTPPESFLLLCSHNGVEVGMEISLARPPKSFPISLPQPFHSPEPPIFHLWARTPALDIHSQL